MVQNIEIHDEKNFSKITLQRAKLSLSRDAVGDNSRPISVVLAQPKENIRR